MLHFVFDKKKYFIKLSKKKKKHFYYIFKAILLGNIVMRYLTQIAFENVPTSCFNIIFWNQTISEHKSEKITQ